MKIQLLLLGKTRRAELRALLDEYVKRISRSCPIEVTEVRDATAAAKKLDADRAATAVKQGRFREDLYYRLDLVKIWMPPLRERRADILALAEHLLAGIGAAHGRPKIRLSEPAKGILERYRWPGNVRELRDALKAAVICGQGEMLEAEHLPVHVRANLDGNRSEAGSRSLEDIEREAIEATLKATRNQIGRSAKILGISRKTLLEKRKKYGWV